MLGATAGAAEALSVTWLGMSYYTFQLSEGKKFELTLSSPSAPSTDADFYIAMGRLPAVDDYDARIADEYSSGSFLGQGSI